MQALLRLSAYSALAAGVLLLLYWFSYVVFLPYGDIPAERGLGPIALSRHWFWINLVGVLGSLCGLVGILGIYLVQTERFGTGTMVGFLLALVGTVLMTAPLCWDTLLWTPLAQHDPQILAFDGPLYQSRSFMSFFIGAGLLQSVGFLVVGIATARAGIFAPWSGILFALGMPLFGFGILAGQYQAYPRTVGLTASAVAFIALGIQLLRRLGT